MDLFDLVAKITLDSSEYESGLDNASGKASSFGDKLGTAMKVGGAAVAAVGTAAVAMTGAFIKGAGDVAAYGDNIDKMSQKMGISAQAYQEWEAVMQHSGTSMETMKASMKTLANAVENGNEAFQRLGISQEQLAKMSQEQIFEATIAGLQNVTDTTERTYLAGQLLGRGATELGALLNTSAEDTQAMRDRVRELGGVMSDEAVKAAAHYRDSLQDMQTAFSGLKRNMMSEFLPAITTVMDGITDLFAGGGTEKISEGISQFTEKISEITPRIMEVGSQIVLALVESIAENLPTLLNSGANAVITIATGLIENLPQIIQTGLEVIVSLANGIVESLPELLPTIVETVMTIVDGLISNVDMLIDAAIAIIFALADGIIASQDVLLEKAPELVIKFVDAIIRNAPKLISAAAQLILKLVEGIVQGFGKLLTSGADIVNQVKKGFAGQVDAAKNWGSDLIDNFISGILSAWNRLKQTVSSVAQTVRNFLGFSEPKEGPLSNFHTYAPDMMQLFAEGIRDNESMLKRTISDAFDFGDATVNSARTVKELPAGKGNAEPITIIVQSVLDGKVIGETAYKYQRNMARAYG